MSGRFVTRVRSLFGHLFPTRPPDLRRRQLLQVAGHGVSWLPPLLIIVAVAMVDQATSGELRTTPWVVLAPAVAAAISGVWVTTFYTAAATLTFWQLDQAWPHQFRSGVPDFAFVVTGGILAILACGVRVRGEHRLVHYQDIAEATRRTVLRPLPPGWGGLDHAAVHLAADVVARIGGDFFDLQPGPFGTRVLVGDVQGKGLGAVDAAGAVMGTFREVAHDFRSLRTVAERLEVRMQRQVAYRRLVGERQPVRFATALLVSFPRGEPGVVEVCNFGHEPPLVVSPTGVRVLDGDHGLPLGLGELQRETAAESAGSAGATGPAAPAAGPGAGPADAAHDKPYIRPYNGAEIESNPWPDDDVMDHPSDWPWTRPTSTEPPPLVRAPLAPGETLLMVTDGVTEARDHHGIFYDLEAEVARGVAADPGIADPWRLALFVRDGTLRHAGGVLADDTTIFAVRRRNPGTSSGASLVTDDLSPGRRTGGRGFGPTR